MGLEGGKAVSHAGSLKEGIPGTGTASAKVPWPGHARYGPDNGKEASVAGQGQQRGVMGGEAGEVMKPTAAQALQAFAFSLWEVKIIGG